MHFKLVNFGETDSGSPDTQAWHDWRAQGIGGSDALAVAAEAGLVPRAELPPWVKKASVLLEEKRGTRKDEFKSNWAVERGKAGEAPIRRIYEERTGNIVSPLFVESLDAPFVRCSLDGMTIDALVIVEIKRPGQAAHELAAQGIVPAYYRIQLAHQALAVWGTDTAKWPEGGEVHYVSGVPETRSVYIVVVPAAELADLARSLFAAEQAFWMTVQREDGLYGQEFTALASAYLAADAAVEAAQDRLKECRAALEAFMAGSGQERMASDGLILSRETRSGSVDYAKLVKELGVEADKIEAYRKPGTTSFVVRKEKPPTPVASDDEQKRRPRKPRLIPEKPADSPYAAIV